MSKVITVGLMNAMSVGFALEKLGRHLGIDLELRFNGEEVQYEIVVKE